MLKDYELKRIGNLSVCYKTFISKKANLNEIDICMWNKDFTRRWTIASFEFDEHGFCYDLVSCGDRLTDKNINANDFFELVRWGYHYLEGVEKYEEIQN